jgi:dTDP-4-amino-4,6-dideoxygalactose transaminase
MVAEPLVSVVVGLALFHELVRSGVAAITLETVGLSATLLGIAIVASSAVLSRPAMDRSVPAARPVFPPQDRRRITAMIDRALEHGSLTLGDYGHELEEAFAARHQSPYAVAVSSGTSALEIALRVFGVEDRDVIVPANTFFASAAAVVHAGGRPRFADVSSATLALSRSTVEAALTDATAGVMLVHIGGLITPEVHEIRALCDERGLFLLEDAAHAHGAAYDGRWAGTFGHAAAFSLYPTKVMTSGEGGVLLTADEPLRDEARVYRDQGKASFLAGGHVRLGGAWRMSEIHAAIGLVQLERLDEFIAARRRAAEVYDTALADVKGVTPLAMPSACASNYYKYVAMLDASIDRDALKRSMRERHGVSMSGEVYATPLHCEPIFAPYADRQFPVAEDVCRRQICLPIHSDMSADEATYVATCLAQERSTE